MNLSARLCHGPALDRARQDHQAYVYRASWVRQARGLGIELETGWVAVDGDDGLDVDDDYLERWGGKTCYHSTASAEAALRGLLRKMARERKEEARARLIKADRARRTEEASLMRAAARDRFERRTLKAVLEGGPLPWQDRRPGDYQAGRHRRREL